MFGSTKKNTNKKQQISAKSSATHDVSKGDDTHPTENAVKLPFTSLELQKIYLLGMYRLLSTKEGLNTAVGKAGFCRQVADEIRYLNLTEADALGLAKLDDPGRKEKVSRYVEGELSLDVNRLCKEALRDEYKLVEDVSFKISFRERLIFASLYFEAGVNYYDKFTLEFAKILPPTLIRDNATDEARAQYQLKINAYETTISIWNKTLKDAPFQAIARLNNFSLKTSSNPEAPSYEPSEECKQSFIKAIQDVNSEMGLTDINDGLQGINQLSPPDYNVNNNNILNTRKQDKQVILEDLITQIKDHEEFSTLKIEKEALDELNQSEIDDETKLDTLWNYSFELGLTSFQAHISKLAGVQVLV
ncbi:MAG: hypothetical protein H0W64_06430 [Gammaproteobacteria bacterium]|nr:hypothetical protein [Gammaproteobacteria bacterium]